MQYVWKLKHTLLFLLTEFIILGYIVDTKVLFLIFICIFSLSFAAIVSGTLLYGSDAKTDSALFEIFFQVSNDTSQESNS